jgi:glutathione synthase/RimK-type ligase-like ATP-grasp enzyme
MSLGLNAALARVEDPIRTVVCYTKNQSLGGKSGDDRVIARVLKESGLNVRMVDLANVHQAQDGSLLLRNEHTGKLEAWRDPHSVLMYHGAIAPEGAMEKLRAMQARGTTVINGPEAWPIYTDKFKFAQHMDAAGVNIIPTRLARSAEQLQQEVAKLGGEAIIKKPVSTEGDDIFLVRTPEDLANVTKQLPHLGDVIVQPLVDSRIGADIEPGIAKALRPEEMGRRHEFRVNSARFADGSVRVDAIYMRVAPDANQVVNNVAQGARPIKVDFQDLHPRDQKTVLDAVRASPPNGEVIGWDLIGQPGKRQIIEGNTGSGLPNGDEGIHPEKIVGSYARILREAGEASGVRQREQLANHALVSNN